MYVCMNLIVSTLLTLSFLIQVKITCATFDGTECNAFSVPTLSCASPLSTVRFNYTGTDCSGSNNAQGDDECTDSNGGPPADTEVLVSCYDNEVPAVLAEVVASPGDDVDVQGSNLQGTGLLPETLECRVTSADGSILYQVLFFNTQASFTAKAQFGSLEVLQCDDLECIIDVTYTYTATNVGEAPINITSMTRIRDGETVDLTDLVDPKELDIGEFTVVDESDKVDYCVASSITTEVRISSDGEECLVRPGRRGLLRHSDEAFVKDVIMMYGRYDLTTGVQ